MRAWEHVPARLAYGVAVLSSAVAILLGLAMDAPVRHELGPLLFIPAITLSAWLGGLGCGMLATALTLLAGGYFFFDPRYVPREIPLHDLLRIALFAGVGVLVSTLIEGLRRSWRRAQTEADSARKAEQSMQLVIDGVYDAIFLHEADGTIIDVNEQMLRMYGVTHEEALRLSIVQDLSGGTANPIERVRQIWGEVMAGRPQFFEWRARRPKDGSEFDVEVFLRKLPLRGRDCILANVRDITQRKQAEGAILEASEQVKAASEAKDRFFAMLSHELRTPLTPVLAATALASRDPDLGPACRENLEMIRRNVELEARLIDDLLDVTRIARGKIDLQRARVELCEVIRRAVEVVTPDLEARKLQFGVDSRDGPFFVDADASRLQQVFWNLLKNSIKFTSEGGCVGLRCRRDGDHVIVEVNDSGVGIAPEALPHIFKPFEQATAGMTRRFGGLGLGLTICKAMVEMHGGTITAHSEGAGKGASFRVELPLVPAPAQAPSPAAAPGGPCRDGRRKLAILLVEDHGDTACMMRRLLNAEGHDVQTAADVAGALDLAGRQGFDLLISDLGLPDASGLDLLRALRARGSRLPAIALSGYGQEQDVAQSREAGFAAHLIKPVSPARLDETIMAVAGPGGP